MNYKDSPFGKEVTIGKRIEDFLPSPAALKREESYKDIDDTDIELFLLRNSCAWANPANILLIQLANGSTTLQEFRNWVLELKNNNIGKTK